jgi:hypothetical protein
MPKKYNLVLPVIPDPRRFHIVEYDTAEDALEYLMQWYPRSQALSLLPVLQVGHRQLFELAEDAPLVCVFCLTPSEREWIADPNNNVLVEGEVDRCGRCQTLFMSEEEEEGT